MIGYSSIECLGHNIVGQTVKPQEDKIQAIREAARPQTKRQMKSFLWLAGFYRRFIPSFSSIASPLTNQTKKDRPNSIKDWQDKHEKAFQTLFFVCLFFVMRSRLSYGQTFGRRGRSRFAPGI